MRREEMKWKRQRKKKTRNKRAGGKRKEKKNVKEKENHTAQRLALNDICKEEEKESWDERGKFYGRK